MTRSTRDHALDRKIIAYIEREGRATGKEIAKLLGCKPTWARFLANRLVDEELIEHAPGESACFRSLRRAT